jgi:predicted SprT family Zn-dependent metalloprotease
MELLKFRDSVIKEQLVDIVDDSEFKRLQGRGKEIKEMISNLTRKPVSTQHTGSFN